MCVVEFESFSMSLHSKLELLTIWTRYRIQFMTASLHWNVVERTTTFLYKIQLIFFRVVLHNKLTNKYTTQKHNNHNNFVHICFDRFIERQREKAVKVKKLLHTIFWYVKISNKIILKTIIIHKIRWQWKSTCRLYKKRSFSFNVCV